MKTLRFGAIALTIVLLSSCGGKEKLTKENGVEILSELLGYPYAITTNNKYQIDARREQAKYLEREGMVERSRQPTGPYAGTPTFLNFDSLMTYAPFTEGAPFECNSFVRSVSICGTFLLAKESIASIENISEESEDGKVTVQFRLERNLSKFYGSYIVFPRNKKRINKLFNDNTTVSVVLQRSQDGWMVLEREDIKPQLLDGSNYFFKAYEMDDFVNYIDNCLNYFEIVAG